ncbi:MAG TPA: hypothetical protein VF516_34750, partial [Kofleriaceae bacterium]
TEPPCALTRGDLPLTRPVMGAISPPPPEIHQPAQIEAPQPPPRATMGLPSWHVPPSQPEARPTRRPAPAAGKRAR